MPVQGGTRQCLNFQKAVVMCLSTIGETISFMVIHKHNLQCRLIVLDVCRACKRYTQGHALSYGKPVGE